MNKNNDHDADTYYVKMQLKRMLPYVALMVAVLNFYILVGTPWISEEFKSVIVPVMRIIALAGTVAYIQISFMAHGVKAKQSRMEEIFGAIAIALFALVIIASIGAVYTVYLRV
jgi:hypothetical protein